MTPIEAVATCGRREAQRASRREAILDVAQQAFLEDGYARTTMSGIAARLGGSKGTLWSYFPSKDLLFAATIDRASQIFRAQFSAILNPRDLPALALGRFAVEFVRRVTSPQAIALKRLVVGEARGFPETGRIFHERAVGLTRELVADYLALAMERGHLAKADPVLAAQQLIYLCMSGCHEQLLLALVDQPTPAMIARDAETSVATFLRAYAI